MSPARTAPSPAPAQSDRAVVRRALRPDQHGALGVRPRHLREDRGHVPRQLQAAGGGAAAGRRLAAAMMAADTPHCLHSL